MANKEALKALQERLAQRLSEARTGEVQAAWLAVEAGGRGWLLPMGQAGEIFPMTTVVPVAHTQPWFAGVTNLRGHLHGVVHLAHFMGLPHRATEGASPTARLITFNASLDAHCALWVDALHGVRQASDMSGEPVPPSQDAPAFATESWTDAGGVTWQVIDLATLASHPYFQHIAR